MNNRQTKSRGSLASPKKQRQSNGGQVTGNAMDLQDELNRVTIESQNKDIEIERLMTTCQTLNAKSQINDDLHAEVDILKRRLDESDTQVS